MRKQTTTRKEVSSDRSPNPFLLLWCMGVASSDPLSGKKNPLSSDHRTLCICSSKTLCKFVSECDKSLSPFRKKKLALILYCSHPMVSPCDITFLYYWARGKEKWKKINSNSFRILENRDFMVFLIMHLAIPGKSSSRLTAHFLILIFSSTRIPHI